MRATDQVLRVLRNHPHGCSIRTILHELAADSKILDSSDPQAYLRGTLSYLQSRKRVESRPIYPEWANSPKKWSIRRNDESDTN